MDLKYIGNSINRVDAYSKVTGKALYPQDLYYENMAFGKTLRSEHPFAKIKIDTSEAELIPGVLKIFTHKDIPNNEHGVLHKDQQIFCDKIVRRIGDPIAFVVAESEKICEVAIKKIKVEYDILEPIFDPIEAMKDDSIKIHGNSNILYHYKLRRGDALKALEDSYFVANNTYRTHSVDQAFLQPEAGIGYVDDDNKVTVVVATQYPHYDREEIAYCLNIPMESVRVLNTNVGGAFGGREDITLQVHLALAAKTLNRVVKCVYSREESFLAHSKRHAIIMKYSTGVDKDGFLTAIKAEIIGDTGAYASWGDNVMRKAGVHATGPYEVKNVMIDSYAVYTNNPYAGAMRGFGATQVAVAYEQQMDIIASELKISPVEIRLKNILRVGSYTATGQLLNNSVPLEQCLKSISE
ncbi:MAG: molybdopterin-dependent oxidoreductase [Tissierellales bacterium]|nr:molybdopterin-dependent oxidoreductase [Tissierellales bacterium]